MAHTVIGTAGHIDHGKTLLVKALTGIDTDRAPEEKSRGITIELGFAFFGDDATIIDVPGHERFVKTMVAGVSTIDVALLVIAADDGVMPQSREHLDVLELLGVSRGIVVVNKTELVDEDWLQLVEDEVRDLVSETFLEDADVLRVSAMTGAGVPKLKQSLTRLISETAEKRVEGPFRLPVDRAFVVKGFGMVCTGTVLSGELREASSVTVYPKGKELRIRGFQKHGQTVNLVSAGDRAAINLPGIQQAEIRRGDILCEKGMFAPTFMIDARLRLLASSRKDLIQRARIRVHLGTAEVMGRIILLDCNLLRPGNWAMVQIRLESPIMAVWGDRFVIRSYSPAVTIGGGHILNPHPPKHSISDQGVVVGLEQLDVNDSARAVVPIVDLSRDGVIGIDQLIGNLGIGHARLAEQLKDLAEEGRVVRVAIGNENFVVSGKVWRGTIEKICADLSSFHSANPLKSGRNREELRKTCAPSMSITLFGRILADAEQEGSISIVGSIISLAEHEVSFSPEESKLRGEIEEVLREATFDDMPDVPELAIRLKAEHNRIESLLKVLQDLNVIISLDGSLFLHEFHVKKIRSDLRKYLERDVEITVSQFRKLISGNRRYALALLNYFDGEGLTVRKGDVRALR